MTVAQPSYGCQVLVACSPTSYKTVLTLIRHRATLWVEERREAMTRIEQLRKIVDTHTAGKVDGVTVDATTANMLVTIHDALSVTSQAKFGDINLMKLIDFGWKNVKVG